MSLRFVEPSITFSTGHILARPICGNFIGVSQNRAGNDLCELII